MSDDAPREYTADEIRKMFLDRMWVNIRFWAQVEATPEEKGESDIIRRLSGVLHSTFAVIDGRTIPLPGFALVPQPHHEDKAYHIAEGENWFPEAPDDLVDIAGDLGRGLYWDDNERRNDNPTLLFYTDGEVTEEQREKLLAAAKEIGVSLSPI